MSPESKSTYTSMRGKKRKQEFRTQYEENHKSKTVKIAKTDSREETQEDFTKGLYISRSRIIDKEGGHNPTIEDVEAADRHILHAIKKAGSWFTFVLREPWSFNFPHRPLPMYTARCGLDRCTFCRVSSCPPWLPQEVITRTRLSIARATLEQLDKWSSAICVGTLFQLSKTNLHGRGHMCYIHPCQRQSLIHI